MKKISKFLSLCLIGLAGVAAVTSCDDKPNDPSNEVVKYTITFNTKGHGTAPSDMTESTIPSSLPTLTDDNYDFEGWYLDDACTQKAQSGTELTENITLYAKWVEKTTPVEPDDPSKIKYQVLAKCINGKAIPGVEITLYDSVNDKEYSAYTAANGYATFNLDKGQYVVEASNYNGYTLKEEYTKQTILTDSTGENPVIELEYDAKIVADSALPDEEYTYSQGDLMYDYTFNCYDFSQVDADGNYVQVSYKLSDLLEENDLVVLNFWYTTCTWCKREFPMMQEAYAEYKDKGVKIIGINPGDIVNDSMQVVKAFVNEMDLKIQSTINDTTLVYPFQVSGWPTSVFIDRYGLIGLVESGAITSKAKWTAVFDEYLGDDYKPVYNDPNGGGFVEPTVEYPGNDALVDASVADGFKDKITFKNEDRSGYEYNWPWKVADFVDKNGIPRTGIQPSNKGVHSSYSIVWMNVTIPANNALAMDIYCSTDDGDMLGVFIDSKRVLMVSGIETTKAQTKYIYVAGDTAEEVSIEFFFYKDSNGSIGDDTVVINNIKYIPVSDVETPVYVMRQASTNFNQYTQKYTNYITPVYNENDGYYHVNTANGPLLLAALIDTNTHFSNKSIGEYMNEYASNKNANLTTGLYFEDEDGSFYDIFEEFYGYAFNSVYSTMSSILQTNGLTPITKELQEAMVRLTNTLGTDHNKETEWLQMCVYVEFYGTNGEDPIGDPIDGLAHFNAWTPVEYDSTNADETTNKTTYTYSIVPRGYYYKFVPKHTGVYNIYSIGSVQSSIYFENITDSPAGYTREIFAFAMGYKYVDNKENGADNFYEFQYFEEGKTYWIKPYYFYSEETGTLEWRIEYSPASTTHYYQASESTFATNVDEDGNMTGDGIFSRPNVEVALGSDDYYHPLDKEGNPIMDEYIYADFAYVTGIFAYSNLVKVIEYKATNKETHTIVTIRGFDFTYDQFGNKYSDEDIKNYNLKDMTDIAKEYCKQLYKKNENGEYIAKDGGTTTDPCTNGVPLDNYDNFDLNPDFGLIKVDSQLQVLLQGLMDKYTFRGIEGSWMKLCYYKATLGPAASSTTND